MVYSGKDKYDISDLLAIVEILRSPGGCPWDIEQTHASIRRNFIEEAYEAAEAIDCGDAGMLKEELGDVLMQVVFHARIEEEIGSFSFSDVCDSVCKKMILRHPHIFSDVKADTAEQVLKNWDAIKKLEKKQDSVYDVLSGVSKALPALMRAEKLLAKAPARPDDTTAAINEAVQALDRIKDFAGSSERDTVSMDIGKLLFAAVRLSSSLGIDAEESLSAICDSFVESHNS